jgi:hypothetical protein
MYYVAPLTFNFDTSSIEVDIGSTDILCEPLWSAIREAQASEQGILYDTIGIASGLNILGAGVKTGITVELLGNWQVHFPTGNYIARIGGGNLIGGPGGDPIAYSAGVQTLLLQSAAATVVSTGGGGSSTAPTAAQNAAAVKLVLTPDLTRIETNTNVINKNTKLIPSLL